MKLSGTWLRRASLISRRSTGFLSGSKQSSPEPSQLTQAFITALRCFWLIFEPVTSAATFCSSTTFQLMYCSMSGWSTSAGAIKSGGTWRRAAKMVIADVDHPDIEQYINWKVVEEQKVAALVTGSR